MIKILLPLIFLYSSVFATINSDEYLKKIQNIENLSYSSLIKNYFFVLGDVVDSIPDSAIENDFFINYSEDNSSAINFHKTRKSQIVEIEERYAVVLYEYEDFYKYAVLLNEKAKVIEIVLLAYRAGNSEWQIQRDGVFKNNNFLVTDSYHNTEWIKHPILGENILTSQEKYRVRVSKNIKFLKELTSVKELYKREDKTLNHFYKKIMKKVGKKKRIELKDVQRSWIKYVTKKCNSKLTFIIEQEKNSVHTQTFKYECLYKETQKRALELKESYEYLEFYK